MKIELDGKVYDLNIDQAKKLNLLKEDSRCKSWEEFRNKYQKAKGFHYDSIHNEILNNYNPYATNEQLTEHEAIAINAFSKLLKLRRDWIGDWEPNWHNSEYKYCVTVSGKHCTIYAFYSDHHAFSFPTKEMAEEFLDCFRDLFEQCKYLI